MSTLSLTKATLQDAEKLHQMQLEAFMPLLKKYEDYETSPANEPLERIITRLNQSYTDYYLISLDGKNIGGIRVVKREAQLYRISPIFILPDYQGKGIAQQVFHWIEQHYTEPKIWELDTIEQEAGYCYLYEKLGYKRTGKRHAINDKMTIIFYEKRIDRPNNA